MLRRYCSLVDPLLLRLFFYIPIVVLGIAGVAFMIPVIKNVGTAWHKSGGLKRLKTSTSLGSKKKKGSSGVKGLPLTVVVRMAMICAPYSPRPCIPTHAGEEKH